MADKWKENWQDGKGLGSALGMASGAASLLTSAYDMATPDTDSVADKVDAQIEAMKQSQSRIQANSMDDLMSQWSSSKIYSLDAKPEDYYNGPSDGDIFTSTLSSTLSGAATGSMAGPWGALAGAVVGLGSGLIGGFIGKNKAQTAANEASSKINAERMRQNAYKKASFQTAAENLVTKNNRMLTSQIAAFGGPLGFSLLPVGGAIDYMQNEELLSSLSEGTNSKKTSLPKFAFGGALGGYGGDWSNGLNFIKAGGTHGDNPIGGVPMGVAQDGMPNLVEEGEVIWNDYVFSNRMNVPKNTLERLGIKGDNMTFAEAVEKAQKNSAERPNDPIEQRGLEAVLAGLMQEQESMRQDKAEKEQFDSMEEAAAFAADGGPIHIAKNKKGTFTAAATKHGMGVQEFAGHVLANKDKYSPAMVKKANFARNASKWSHAMGGRLFLSGGYKLGPDWKPLDNVIFDKTWQPPTELDFDFKGISQPSTTSTNKPSLASWLRYAPILGSSVGLGYTLLNQPDYEYADELEKAAEQYAGNVSHVTPQVLGDRLAYNPFDRMFYANELGAQQAATRRAIMNSGNGNAGQTMAALLASSYNDNIGLGRLYREGEEYNLNQRQKVAEFNRATNQYNSEADLKAQMFNAELDKAKAATLLDAKMKALGLKQAEDQAWDASLAANLTGLFDNIGDIGRESYAMDIIRNNPSLLYDWLGNYKSKSAKKGGYLTIKNRRRR